MVALCLQRSQQGEKEGDRSDAVPAIQNMLEPPVRQGPFTLDGPKRLGSDLQATYMTASSVKKLM